MSILRPRAWTRLTALLAALALGAGTARASLLDYVGECVPFARAASGIQLYGDAWTWWDGAEGKYRRGYVPKVGSVIVFARSSRLPQGHVAVISRVVEPRVAMVTHANWSRLNGERGHAEQDVTLFDVSREGDWSEVRVWYRDTNGLGGSVYPVYGFVYPEGKAGVTAHPSAQLSSAHPDYVGALIDAYR